jgi:hypothetical protein
MPSIKVEKGVIFDLWLSIGTRQAWIELGRGFLRCRRSYRHRDATTRSMASPDFSGTAAAFIQWLEGPPEALQNKAHYTAPEPVKLSYPIPIP